MNTRKKKSKSAQGDVTGKLPTFVFFVEDLCLTRV